MDHYLQYSDGDDLDKLIKKVEFENQTFVRLIHKECQHIEALEKEIGEGKTVLADLQEKISQLDDDTSQGQRQYTYNRENCESLKKTLVVLKEHDEALDRQLTALEESAQHERNGHKEILQHYNDVWEDYQGKYKMFPLAQSLEEKKSSVSSLEKQLQEMETQIKQLHVQIHEIKESTDDELKDLNKFVINLAAVKLSTESMSCKIRQTVEVRRQIQEKIRKKKESRQKTEEQIIKSVREDTNTSEPSMKESFAQDQVQLPASQNCVDPHANLGHDKPRGISQQDQLHLSSEPIQVCLISEQSQSCSETQPSFNTESLQPCMEIQESDEDGGSMLISMFSKKQDDVDTEKDMETNVNSSLRPTACHPLMVLPQNLSSSQSCPQPFQQGQQRHPHQKQQPPQQCILLPPGKRQSQHMQQPLQQVQLQPQPLQKQLQQKQQQIHCQSQLEQQARQTQLAQQKMLQTQKHQQFQHVQQQKQQVQQQAQQLVPQNASDLNQASLNYDNMLALRPADIDQKSACQTPNYSQIVAPRAPSISQMPTSRTLNRITAPAALTINQVPAAPKFRNQVSAPRPPSIKHMSAPKAPTFNKISITNVSTKSQISAPRVSGITQMQMPKTPNWNSMSTPNASNIRPMSSPRTGSDNISTTRAPSSSQILAPKAQNGQIPSTQRVPTQNQTVLMQKEPNNASTSSSSSDAAVVCSPQLAQRPRQPDSSPQLAQRPRQPDSSPQLVQRPRQPDSSPQLAQIPRQPDSSPQLAQRPRQPDSSPQLAQRPRQPGPSPQLVQRPRQPDSPPQLVQRPDSSLQTELCPKTPPSAMPDHDEMGLSPFDFEKHQEKVKLLSKSPGPISFSSRTMFKETQNDPQDSVGDFLNPFMGEASNLFRERTADSFETGQPMSLFGNDKASSVFGDGGKNSIGNHSSCGGESLMMLFGGGDQTSPDVEGKEQETSFSLNFCTDKSGDSLMSLFGGGTDNSTQGNNTKETNFSINFGGGSNSPGSSRGFNLF
ncbi:putative mediator of RNA polymerase II transcription subunit 26 [Ylistrum balloti]|uniref:putative mediator of RNA polymerase II transcription subunit 26 n=1 Tax=Ylistrum balloti TaxID=509963 RepID=UPI002905AADB|nr:putative mediator of RNA polymerase II transcription subunit 26 [Ylistrum balloti]